MSRLLVAAAAALTLTLVTACGTGEAATTAPSADARPALVVKDQWVKTAPSGMSAAYATLVNTTGKDVIIVSATSSASPKMELHETTMVDGKMAMRPKDGGFVIAAGASHEFKPGGDHLMLMDVTTPVQPGDEVTITLTLKDGGTVRFTAPGKDFAGGNETYDPGTGHGNTASPMVMGG